MEIYWFSYLHNDVLIIVVVIVVVIITTINITFTIIIIIIDIIIATIFKIKDYLLVLKETLTHHSSFIKIIIIIN